MLVGCSMFDWQQIRYILENAGCQPMLAITWIEAITLLPETGPPGY